MGNQQNNANTLKKIKEIPIQDIDSIIVANNRYIISDIDNMSLKIEDIYSNLSSIIQYKSISFKVIFHPRIENIFLLADGNDIKIYQIKEDSCKCNQIVSATGHSQLILSAVFSNTNDKIFATLSMDKTIKVWNLEYPFCICNILLNNSIDNMQIYKNFIFYYDKGLESIIQYDLKNLQIINKFEVKTKKFIIINDETLCLFNLDSLSVIEKGKEIKNSKLNGIYIQSFFDEELQLLYIFYSKRLEILDIKNMKLIISTKLDEQIKIFYSNKSDELNKIAYFIILFRNRIEYYRFNYEEGYKSKINIESKKKGTNKSIIFTNIVPTISNIENLRWEANYNEDVPIKKYLYINEIKDELDLDYKKSLNEKKIEVNNYLQKYKPSEFDYIQLIKLIIKDNTNKELIIEYLKYLNDNKDNNLSSKYNNNFESFEAEYDNYKVLFDDKYLKDQGFKGKDCSQKEIFKNILNKIISLNIEDNNMSGDGIENSKLNLFRKEIDEKISKMQLFNQPIDISNIELYWQRNCNVLFLGLKTILENYNKLKLMKESIKMILDKKILDKEYIINDNILLTIVIALIVIPQCEKYLKYNLNLLETKDPNYNYENEIKNYNLKEFNVENNIKYYLEKNEKYHFLYEPSKKCINNFILNAQDEMYLEDFEEMTYDEQVKFYDEIIDFKKMKTFLSKIFVSRVIKEAFEYLYPDYYKFPFKNEEEAFNFLEKYFHFIPLKNLSTAWITEKFSLEIYYILKKRKNTITSSISNEICKLIKKILYRGAAVKTSCHEINHEFYNILLMITNGKVPIETPRKKYFNESESGKNMEMILFNYKIRQLSLKQCLYLLNLKNYEKSLQDFRKGFNELIKEDLIFDDNSLFHEFNEVVKSNNFDEIAKTSEIKCDDNDEYDFLNDTYIEDIEDTNDVLGFIRDPS